MSVHDAGEDVMRVGARADEEEDDEEEGLEVEKRCLWVRGGMLVGCQEGLLEGFGEGVTCHVRCGVVAGCIGVKMSAGVVLMSFAEFV